MSRDPSPDPSAPDSTPTMGAMVLPQEDGPDLCIAPADASGGVATPDALQELESGLRALRELLDRDAVRAARELVEELARRWPASEQVRHLAHVLSPPVARVRPDLRRRVHERERAWLRENAGNYPGCWLAVVEDRLVAADRSLGNVLERLRETPGTEDALLHYQPGTVP